MRMRSMRYYGSGCWYILRLVIGLGESVVFVIRFFSLIGLIALEISAGKFMADSWSDLEFAS